MSFRKTVYDQRFEEAERETQVGNRQTEKSTRELDRIFERIYEDDISGVISYKRFDEVNSGKITVDGVNTAEMPRGGLRKNFGMVLQDTWLFSGTVAENIAYSKPDATREEIINATKAAKVDYFIRTMPHGYDTMLDNEASNLSAGQRQLLTIARVFLCNPPILILDEATSSVDIRTEVESGKAMKKLMSGRISFVIAHRLSTIRDADTILFVEHGNIIEQGNHKELLEKRVHMQLFTTASLNKNSRYLLFDKGEKLVHNEKRIRNLKDFLC